MMAHDDVRWRAMAHDDGAIKKNILLDNQRECEILQAMMCDGA
jgi:hypothetical protein